MPQLFSTPKAKFSMTMSEMDTRRRMRSMPRSVRVLRVTLSLLALVSLKWPLVLRLMGKPSGVPCPEAMFSPRVLGFWGHSTLMTSAPRGPQPARAPGAGPHPGEVQHTYPGQGSRFSGCHFGLGLYHL